MSDFRESIYCTTKSNWSKAKLLIAKFWTGLQNVIYAGIWISDLKEGSWILSWSANFMNSRIVVESFSFFCILTQFQNVEIENFLLTLSFAWFCQASKRFSSSQMIKCYCEVHILPYRIPCEKKNKTHLDFVDFKFQ